VSPPHCACKLRGVKFSTGRWVERWSKQLDRTQEISILDTFHLHVSQSDHIRYRRYHAPGLIIQGATRDFEAD
jgi:hypothetical protein